MTAREILEDAGLASSHWGKRIINAEYLGKGFIRTDRRDAGDWFSCACGKQDPRIPRGADEGEPLDHILWVLGVKFEEYVNLDKFEDAAQTLVAIETRAAELLRDLE